MILLLIREIYFRNHSIQKEKIYCNYFDDVIKENLIQISTSIKYNKVVTFYVIDKKLCNYNKAIDRYYVWYSSE